MVNNNNNQGHSKNKAKNFGVHPNKNKSTPFKECALILILYFTALPQETS